MRSDAENFKNHHCPKPKLNERRPCRVLNSSFPRLAENVALQKVNSIRSCLNTPMLHSVAIKYTTNITHPTHANLCKSNLYLISCFSFICCIFCISMFYHWQRSRCTLGFFQFSDFYLLNYVNYMLPIFLIQTSGRHAAFPASCESVESFMLNSFSKLPPDSQQDGKSSGS